MGVAAAPRACAGCGLVSPSFSSHFFLTHPPTDAQTARRPRRRPRAPTALDYTAQASHGALSRAISFLP